jgi:hypothetical protein
MNRKSFLLWIAAPAAAVMTLLSMIFSPFYPDRSPGNTYDVVAGLLVLADWPAFLAFVNLRNLAGMRGTEWQYLLLVSIQWLFIGIIVGAMAQAYYSTRIARKSN